jgi:predicted metalloprotease with PDZ domain
MKRTLITGVLTSLFLSAGCAQNGNTQKGLDSSKTKEMSTTADTDLAPKPSVMLGVNMVPSGPIMSKHLGVDGEYSTMIIAVGENTPASKAGLELWDVVVTVQGSGDASPSSLRRMLRASKPGDVIDLEVIRGTKTITIKVALEEADHDRMIPLPVGTDGT